MKSQQIATQISVLFFAGYGGEEIVEAAAAMRKVSFAHAYGSNEVDATATMALAAKCLDRGLPTLTRGVYSDTVCLLTPLTASEMILKERLDIPESATLGN